MEPIDDGIYLMRVSALTVIFANLMIDTDQLGARTVNHT
jgi:hypothetical protein